MNRSALEKISVLFYKMLVLPREELLRITQEYSIYWYYLSVDFVRVFDNVDLDRKPIDAGNNPVDLRQRHVTGVAEVHPRGIADAALAPLRDVVQRRGVRDGQSREGTLFGHDCFARPECRSRRGLPRFRRVVRFRGDVRFQKSRGRGTVKPIVDVVAEGALHLRSERERFLVVNHDMNSALNFAYS